MGEIGKHHWKSASPASLLKQDPLEHFTQDCVHMASEYLQRRRFHNSILISLLRKKKQYAIITSWSTFNFQILPLEIYYSANTTTYCNKLSITET